MRYKILYVLISLLSSESAFSQKTAILCKTLIDGTGKTLSNVAVITDGERIVSVGKKENIPAGTTTIDLGELTLLPGFIDMHCHPLGDGDDDYQTYHLKNSSADKAMRCLKNVQGLLHQGWTTIRVPGDLDVGYAHFAVRKAINNGMFEGPRIFGAGHWISVTGGGGDLNFFSYEQSGVKVDGLVADGPEELRKAIREEIKYGSDWIKLLVTGAFMTAGDNPQNVHFSPEELKVAMDEAARRDVPVMAHAHSAEGIKMSILAGAKTIEHGSFLDDEGINLFLKHDTYLIPTLTIGKWFLDFHEDSQALSKAVALTKKYRVQIEAMLSKAIKAGVKVGIGSDLTGSNPEYHVTEFYELVRLGMTPMQAIQAGTKVNAEALGKIADLGTLESGKFADMVAVKGDPLKDIKALGNVKFVMKGGKVVRLDK
jgi:imidazolonepropionase-like amidohydrolase